MRLLKLCLRDDPVSLQTLALCQVIPVLVGDWGDLLCVLCRSDDYHRLYAPTFTRPRDSTGYTTFSSICMADDRRIIADVLHVFHRLLLQCLVLLHHLDELVGLFDLALLD